MINPTKLSVILVLALLGLGCERNITVELAPHVPRLAVYAMLQPDSLAAVWVTQTQSTLDGSPILSAQQAEVLITPEGQTPQRLTLVHAEEGKYQGTFRPQAGVTYQLSVSAEGFPPVAASTRVPQPVAVQLTDYASEVVKSSVACTDCWDSAVYHHLALTFQDPAPEENYYEVMGWKDYLYEVLSFDSLGALDTILLRPSTTRLNFRSNDLTVATAEDAVLAAQYENLYIDNLPFTDQLVSGKAYTFRCTVVDSELSTKLIVLFRNYHPDAYRYERAKEQQQGNHHPDQLFYEPVQIPTNARGGYGIFSSFSQDSVVIKLDG